MRVLLLLGALLTSTAAGVMPAATLLAAGQYAQAYDAAHAAGSDLAASDAALAEALYHAADPQVWLERAVTAGRAAIRTAPDDARAHLTLGTALCSQAARGGFTLGAYQLSRACRDEYERSLILNPGLTEARAALARWHSGAWVKAGVIGGGRPDTARTLAAHAQAQAPDSVRVLVQVGLVAVDLRDDAWARSTFRQALALSPDGAQERDLQAVARAALARLP
ncbi:MULTISPECIES: hypothetical protein [Deinococcus]|uniref:Tetratricopeptide repeat protein n=1 Tax=Deinococcus rufus TaxID=2136097 RepID=A0ABV7Z5D4_9DEIO|nr:hypothetical protein [Deinococcus sp. AB2017081]WQE96549.1 hypothetical protein U2P90_06525 [Deinococcus sp. AB2017081]